MIETVSRSVPVAVDTSLNAKSMALCSKKLLKGPAEESG